MLFNSFKIKAQAIVVSMPGPLMIVIRYQNISQDLCFIFSFQNGKLETMFQRNIYQVSTHSLKITWKLICFTSLYTMPTFPVQYAINTDCPLPTLLFYYTGTIKCSVQLDSMHASWMLKHLWQHSSIKNAVNITTISTLVK